MNEGFRTITDLAGENASNLGRDWTHHLRCGNDLYLVECGQNTHFRCFACGMCVELDWFFGQLPMYHTETGSGAVSSLTPLVECGDEPPGGCRPGMLPTAEESVAAIAAALEEVIYERYGTREN